MHLNALWTGYITCVFFFQQENATNILYYALAVKAPPWKWKETLHKLSNKVPPTILLDIPDFRCYPKPNMDCIFSVLLFLSLEVNEY